MQICDKAHDIMKLSRKAIKDIMIAALIFVTFLLIMAYFFQNLKTEIKGVLASQQEKYSVGVRSGRS